MKVNCKDHLFSLAVELPIRWDRHELRFERGRPFLPSRPPLHGVVFEILFLTHPDALRHPRRRGRSERYRFPGMIAFSASSPAGVMQ